MSMGMWRVQVQPYLVSLTAILFQPESEPKMVLYVARLEVRRLWSDANARPGVGSEMMLITVGKEKWDFTQVLVSK